MSKSKIALIAALVGMNITSPAFGQSHTLEGCVLPYHYESETMVWGSWYGPAGNQRREGSPRSRDGVGVR
jgi:hypothetical protein